MHNSVRDVGENLQGFVLPFHRPAVWRNHVHQWPHGNPIRNGVADRLAFIEVGAVRELDTR